MNITTLNFGVSGKPFPLNLVAGLGAILMGIPYMLRAFGPTEAEVVTWGFLCTGTGLVLTTLAITLGQSKNVVAKVGLTIGYLFLIVLQLPPSLLWIAFHGHPISDGTPPDLFLAHWGYALPHIALLIVSVIILYGILQSILITR